MTNRCLQAEQVAVIKSLAIKSAQGGAHLSKSWHFQVVERGTSNIWMAVNIRTGAIASHQDIC